MIVAANGLFLILGVFLVASDALFYFMDRGVGLSKAAIVPFLLSGALFWSSARIKKMRESLKTEIAGTATDEGLMLTTRGTESKLSWSAFANAVKARDLLLLRFDPYRYYGFPRSFFASDADWDAFSTMVGNKIQTRPRKSLPGFVKSILTWVVAILLTVILFKTIGR